MTKSILLVSFQFPPVQASSGLLRALAFSKDLSDLGWKVNVLTANVIDDELNKEDNTQLVPDRVKVTRTRAIDAAQKLSFRGRYPGILEWPDRHSSWLLSATVAGYRQVKKQNIDVILSTYPTATAQLVGFCLATLTGKPWIADFRDPMVMAEHPDTKLRRQAHTWVERRTIEKCGIALMTNHHAKAHYINKFPNVNPEKFHVVENGFDEDLFKMAEACRPDHNTDVKSNNLKILHSGTLYPNHRDPTSLFRAIKALSSEWAKLDREVKFVFRASGYDEHFQSMIEDFGIQQFVEFVKPVSYVDSMTEMLSADALLLIQGSSCNQQIPAKLYEYLRSGRPIISITDRAGATASMLDRVGVTSILSSDPTASIESELSEVVERILSGDIAGTIGSPSMLERFSRRYWSEHLAQLLSDIVAGNTPSSAVNTG